MDFGGSGLWIFVRFNYNGTYRTEAPFSDMNPDLKIFDKLKKGDTITLACDLSTLKIQVRYNDNDFVTTTSDLLSGCYGTREQGFYFVYTSASLNSHVKVIEYNKIKNTVMNFS